MATFDAAAPKILGEGGLRGFHVDEDTTEANDKEGAGEGVEEDEEEDDVRVGGDDMGVEKWAPRSGWALEKVRLKRELLCAPNFYLIHPTFFHFFQNYPGKLTDS